MRYISLISALLLSACGVADVGTSAATAAKLQADQAKQGQENIKKAQSALDAAAQQAEQQRAEAEKKAD